MAEQVNPLTEDVLDPDAKKRITFHGLREAEVLINFDLSKIPMGKIMELEKLLHEMGINFDTGTDFRSRDWEWDWSLSGPVNVFFKMFVEDDPKNRYVRKTMKKVVIEDDPTAKDDEAPKDAESTN